MPYYTVLVSVNGNQSAYAIDPVPNRTEAENVLNMWPSGNVTFECFKSSFAEPLVFPAYCDTCDLFCVAQPSNNFFPFRIDSASLTATNNFALFLITIGSPICGVGVILLVVYVTLYQNVLDARKAARPEETDDEGIEFQPMEI